MAKELITKRPCPDCGLDMALVGTAHRCRPQKVETISVREVMKQQGHEMPPPKKRKIKADKTSAVTGPVADAEGEVEIHEATEEDFSQSVTQKLRPGGRRQINITLPADMIKELKIAAAESELTIERSVELAIKGWLEERGA